MNPFDRQLAAHRQTLARARVRTLQVNVGRKGNQAYRHCHVDAAPWQTEMMDATPANPAGWPIQTGEHCLGCTAGAGSSCTGALN